MKLKGKRIGEFKPKLGLLAVFFLCIFFILAGLLGSIILSQDVRRYRSRQRVLESVEKLDDDSLLHGETGESIVASIPFQVLSWKPRAVYFPNFATAEQCQSIIEMAKSKLSPSTLAQREGETAESTKGVRTSSGTFLSSSNYKTGVLDFVEEKIARATMIPRNHGEAFNILRYEIGQRYVSHFDAFDPAEYGSLKSQRVERPCFLLSNIIFKAFHGCGKSSKTFHPQNGSNIGKDYDYKSCIGLKVKPRQGDGLLFYSLFPNGTIDQTSLHGSCPVILGQKWVATKWIRDQALGD